MAGKDLKEKNYIITTAEISEILGLTTRRIQQLATVGALVRESHGKFNLPASINSYLDHLMERDQTEGDLDKTEEEAKWTRARRQKTELEVKIMRGELHRSEDVERVMNDMLGNFRAKLLSMPTKMAPQLLGNIEVIVMKEKIKEAIYEAMDELSDYDPNVFYNHSKDKMFLDDEEEVLLNKGVEQDARTNK